jgi:hypothetical protein
LEQGGFGAVPGIEPPQQRVVEVFDEQGVAMEEEVTPFQEGPGLF